MTEQNGQRLVAGDHAGDQRRQRHSGEYPRPPGQRADFFLNAVQQARSGEQPGIGGGHRHHQGHMDHGDDAAPVEHGGQLRCFGGIAGQQQARQLRRGHPLGNHRDPGGQQDAAQQRELHRRPEQG